MPPSPSITRETTYEPSLALLIGLAWLAIAAQLLWFDWDYTGRMLGDSDDAMRLLQVRELIAGRGWFDLHEPRLQPPLGYDTHWSRMLDAGLAGLYLLLRPFADAALAERLMRVVWPLVWVLPAMLGALALAARLGGRAAAVVLLLLLIMGLPAFTQFSAGRIDHHSVQITLAVGALAAAAWADRVTWAAWLAGLMSGAGLAVGVEGAPFAVVAGGLLAVRFARDRSQTDAAAKYGAALAAATALMFVINIGPRDWLVTACDGFALNTAVPAVLGGVALAAATRLKDAQAASFRWNAVLAAAALAAAAFVWLEPRCLAGPLATVDPTVREIWLAHVNEAQSLLDVARGSLSLAIGVAAFPLLALAATLVLARDPRLRGDIGFLGLAAALALGAGMTIVAVRGAHYVFWLGMPMVAAMLPRLFSALGLKTLPAMALAAMPFTPVAASWGSMALAEMFLPSAAASPASDEPCLAMKQYRDLARLPPGLVVTDVDYGPFVLALTPHAVLAAPYHRLAYGITTSYRVFASPPDEAREILREVKADYLMTCGMRGPRNLSDSDLARSLWTRLKEGHVPAWLEPIPSSSLLGVYRVKP